jgi:HEAT repeat protein
MFTGTLLGFAGALSACPVIGAEKIDPDPDVQILRQWGVGTEGKALLAYLKRRTGNDEDLLALPTLTKDLEAQGYKSRQRAQRKLINLGPCTLQNLLPLMKDGSAEVARRASACCAAINEGFDWGLDRAVLRQLVKLQQDTTLSAVLNYLPYAPDDTTKELIWFSVESLVLKQPRLLLELTKALSNAVPERRALAGCLVARLGDHSQRQLARNLLRDPVPYVRLRTAQGFLAGNSLTGIPALISLLADPDLDIAWQAEELLHWTATDTGPRIHIGLSTGEGPRKCQAAWQRWWHHHNSGLDLTKILQGPERPGLVLSYEFSPPVSAQGSHIADVSLCGSDGLPRWTLRQRHGGYVAQHLRSGRLLVVEGLPAEGKRRPHATHIQELTLTGQRTWSFTIARDRLYQVQRLPNGNISLMSSADFLELDQNAKTVHHCSVDRSLNLYEGTRLSRSYALVLDLAQNAVGLINVVNGTFQTCYELPKGFSTTRRLILLDNAHAVGLCERRNASTLFELDGSGKLIWTCQLPDARAVIASLPYGTKLVRRQRGFSQVCEVSPRGHIWWEFYSRRAGEHRVTVVLPLVRFGFSQPRPSDLDLGSVQARTKQLSHQDTVRRICALAELEGCSDCDLQGSILGLIDRLKDPVSAVQTRAAGILLRGLGPAADDAVLRGLKDVSSLVRRHCAFILCNTHPRPLVLVQTLPSLLIDVDPKVRATAFRGLVTAWRRLCTSE